MQLLLDNLVATVVAGVVGLLLITVNVGHAEGVRDTTRMQAHQAAQAALVEVLEVDLLNAGVLAPGGAPAVAAASGDAPFTSEFTFYGQVDRSGTGGWITYRTVPAGTLDGSPVVAVERWVEATTGPRGSGTPVRTGGAAGVLSQFEIEALAEGGAALTTGGPLGDVRTVRIETEWVLPFTDGQAAGRQALRRSAWATHIRPIGLQP